MFTTVINNGTVIDPANRVHSQLNIGIKDDVVAALSLGAAADIVIFDYNKLEDKATFAAPLAPPAGINYVLIGGGQGRSSLIHRKTISIN